MSLSKLLGQIADNGEPEVLDHVPVPGHGQITDRHQAELQKAAIKYGRPFKCAPAGLPRERLQFVDDQQEALQILDTNGAVLVTEQPVAPLRLRAVGGR